MKHHTTSIAQRVVDIALREANIEWEKTHKDFAESFIEKEDRYLREFQKEKV